MKTVCSFETLGSDYILTQCHIAEKRNRRQRMPFVNNVVDIITEHYLSAEILYCLMRHDGAIRGDILIKCSGLSRG